MGWSNLILEPTLALIRAQLGFRIQVRAKCGKKRHGLKILYFAYGSFQDTLIFFNFWVGGPFSRLIQTLGQFYAFKATIL